MNEKIPDGLPHRSTELQDFLPWFERAFPEKPPVENLPFVIERLRGAPPRVIDRTRNLTPQQLTTKIDGAWSIQEHVGHLGDLEPLWYGRVEDFLQGLPELRPADLTNRKTHEADHNSRSIDELIAVFEQDRAKLVERLETLSHTDVARTALHPRLKQPMRVMDLCTFVADHDDHHFAVVTKTIRSL